MADDIHTLERKIEADREMLSHTTAQLIDALSPDRISAAMAQELRAHGGTLGHTALDAARANPAAAVLVGAGLAAFFAGPKRPKTAQPDDTAAAPRRSPSGHGARTGAFDARFRAAETAGKRTEPQAPRLRAALDRGLEGLPEPARKKILQARSAAIEVQEKLDRKAAAAARKASRFHQRQPLSAGALALGIGAVAAALLPRTRAEDDALGAHRDALLQQAELILRDELAAAATGEAALRDGSAAGQDRPRQH